MGRWMWGLCLVSSLLMAGCGGSRERAAGTRNGPGSPTGQTPDSGVTSPTVDGGQVGETDAGQVLMPPDGGTGEHDAGTGAVELDRSALVGDLSAEERAEFCRRLTAAQGEDTVTCSEEVEITPNTQQECEADTSGGACTVGQVLDCMDSLDGDLCNILVTPECQALFEC